MGQRPGLVLGQRLQPVAPNPLKITNISILVVPNTPTTRMLILLILIILPATPFPLSLPAFHTTPIPARHSPYPIIPHRSYSRTPFPLSPSFHTAPVPARQTPLTTRSRHLSKHPHIPCLTAIPYLFAMASMASVKESRLLFIDFLLSLCLER